MAKRIETGWTPRALFDAWKDYEKKTEGAVSISEIGRRAARRLGLSEEAISSTVIHNYFGGREPPFSIGVAIADVLGANPADVALPTLIAPGVGRPPIRRARGAAVPEKKREQRGA